MNHKFGPVADIETDDSVWKNCPAAFIDPLAQIDDISWSETARQTDNGHALSFAHLDCCDDRRKQIKAVDAKAKTSQK